MTIIKTPSAPRLWVRCVCLLAIAAGMAALPSVAYPQEPAPASMAPPSEAVDPSQDILIEGLGFSKLILALEIQPGLANKAGFTQFNQLLEKNLCWSGVFNLSGGTSSFCRLRGKPERVDMRLTLTQGKHKNLLQLYDTGPEKLKLFQETIAIGAKVREREIMGLINRLTKRLTGQSGLLGSSIGFVLRQPGFSKVIVYTSTHGQELRKLSEHPDINILPRFAPYGRGLVYTALGQRGSHVFYKNLTPSRKGVPQSHFLTPPGTLNSGGAFSPGGHQIVVTMSVNQNADLFLFDLMKRRHFQLTSRKGIETQAHWSPDGKKLIFVSDRSGTPQIYLMDLKKREDIRLTFESHYNADPKWSPDGKSILFTRRYQGVDQIHVMDQFGENARMVSKGRYYSEQAEWSPDGRQVVFASNRTGEFKLYIVSADGSNLRRLTATPKGLEENSPTWTYRRIIR